MTKYDLLLKIGDKTMKRLFEIENKEIISEILTDAQY